MIWQELVAAKILAIDDDALSLKLISRIMARAGCSFVYTVSDPHEAVDAFQRIKPDLVLLDLHLPEIDGYELLGRLQDAMSIDGAVPVMVVSGDGSEEARQRALTIGASDVVTKGIDETEFILRVRNNLRISLIIRQASRQKEWLEELVRQRTTELRRARLEVLERLAAAAEYRDDHTGAHTRRVGRLCAEIARELGQPESYCRTIGSAALLHDLGKIGVPDAILLKPGKLDEAEYALIKEHTTIGAEILEGCEEPLLKMAREIVMTHHERWDGAGYPRGLAGGDIPLCGRIVAVADAFDAMTSLRPYKAAASLTEARDEIARESNAHFDPLVVSAFLRVIDHMASEFIALAA